MSGSNQSSGLGALAERYLPTAQVPGSGEYGSGLVSLTAVRAFLWRQKYILLGILAASLLAGLIITILMTPIYKATSTVRVEVNSGEIIEGQNLEPFLSPNEIARHLETLAGVVRSNRMALRVVDELKLHENESILGKAARQPAPAGMSAAAWTEQRRQMASSVLRSSVEVEVPTLSRILSIHFSAKDPALSAAISNAYAEGFSADSIEQSQDANAYAKKYLEEQIAEVRQNLQTSELQSIDYARANKILGQPLSQAPIEAGDTSAGTAPTLTAANLIDVNQSYTAARARRIAAEQRWQAVSGFPASQIPEVQQNGAIQSLRGQLATLESKLSDLRERYQDDYPQVRELKSEITSLTRKINERSAEIKNGLRSEYQIALRQEQGLSQELDLLSGKTLDEQDRRVQFNLLDRQVAAYRTQLESLLDRYNSISAASNIRSNSVTLLDRATVPAAPSSPNLPRNLLIALLLGGGLAAGVAVLRESLDDRVRSAEDIDRKLGIPALGQTPYSGSDIAAEIDDPFSPLSEAYASIRATLDLALPLGEHRIIQFTSGQASEGKTTSAVALARKYAAIGRKVLLIDLDLRRPAVSRMFGLARTDTGIVDVLYSRVTFEKARLTNVLPNLDLVPVGAIPANPVEILSSGLVAEFLKRYRDQYDLIVIDSSPVMGIADAPLLSRFVDAVVVVVEANSAHFGQSKAAINRLRAVRAPLLGAILTKFRALEAGQSYSYQYNYYTYGSENRD